MDSDKAQQLSDEFGSKLSVLIPEINQLIQQCQVSGTLKTKLKILSSGCVYKPPGGAMCTENPPQMEFVPGLLSFGETSEPDPEIAQQFWTNIASKLFEPLTFLNQSIQQTGEIFEVYFLIDSATVNPQEPVVCEWISDDILKCSQR